MSTAFDPRTTPMRDDLAAAHLKGAFERPRYAEGSLRRVTAPALPLSFAPTVGARLETEILFGEEFIVYDEKDGWAWGQATRDGYVGYLPAADLSSDITSPSHVVVAPASHVYPEPDLKRPPLCRLSFESRVSVDETKDGFCRIADGGWIFAKHLAPADVFESDYIETGRKLIGIPYLWGGRTVLGLDCSAFVQLVLLRAGIEAPRDSDQQADSIGTALAEPCDLTQLRHGDLIFFPGHAGFVMDGWRFLHANAFDMSVAVHGLSDVLDRANAAGEGIAGVRRIWLDHERRQEPRQ